GSNPIQSLPSTVAHSNCRSSVLLPASPWPERIVGCRRGMRSYTSQCRGGAGTSSHVDMSMNGRGGRQSWSPSPLARCWSAPPFAPKSSPDQSQRAPWVRGDDAVVSRSGRAYSSLAIPLRSMKSSFFFMLQHHVVEVAASLVRRELDDLAPGFHLSCRALLCRILSAFVGVVVG